MVGLRAHAAHAAGMAFPYDNLAIPFAVAALDFGLGRGEREGGGARTDTPVAAGRETASINPTSSSLAPYFSPESSYSPNCYNH